MSYKKVMGLKEGKLPTAFQMAQVGVDKPRCFIIGGTHKDNDDPSTHWTREILIEKNTLGLLLGHCLLSRLSGPAYTLLFPRYPSLNSSEWPH